jgi:hypothetical protein
MTKKQRKETLVDEVLADRDIKNYSKRKYEEIQTELKDWHTFKPSLDSLGARIVSVS